MKCFKIAVVSSDMYSLYWWAAPTGPREHLWTPVCLPCQVGLWAAPWLRVPGWTHGHDRGTRKESGTVRSGGGELPTSISPGTCLGTSIRFCGLAGRQAGGRGGHSDSEGDGLAGPLVCVLARVGSGSGGNSPLLPAAVRTLLPPREGLTPFTF